MGWLLKIHLENEPIPSLKCKHAACLQSKVTRTGIFKEEMKQGAFFLHTICLHKHTEICDLASQDYKNLWLDITVN